MEPLATYVARLISRGLVHEIHTSERRSFRSCRRRWGWIHRDNYYPTTTPKPLEFGIAFHVAMETLFKPETWKFNHLVLGALAEKAFVDTCRAQLKTYLNNKREFALEGEESDDYDERMALGRGMIWYFVNNQLEAIQREFVPVYVEASFDVPLLDPITGEQLLCKCKVCRKAFAKAGGGKWRGNPMMFSGRVDLIVHDMQGAYWIWDWKSAAQLSTSEEFLELDDQVAGYCWAFRKAMNLNIRGFIYHEQRKAFPEPPTENKVIRLGRKFSVNVNQPTDYDTYLKTVSENDTSAFEAGLYDDFLEHLKLNGTVFYKRFIITKSDYELNQVELNLVAEALDMTDPNLRIYPMPGRFSCNGCAFKVPCMSKNSGLDYQYTLETLYVQHEPYYAKKLPLSTESRGHE